ncbi:hypothetical protein H6771_00155 [Candidatus Peribacteria bacterium]|nr:hypothetical protein [Candidatus Peribacteria bacterium]
MNTKKNIRTIADFFNSLYLRRIYGHKVASDKGKKLTQEKFLAEYGNILLDNIDDFTACYIQDSEIHFHMSIKGIASIQFDLPQRYLKTLLNILSKRAFPGSK